MSPSPASHRRDSVSPATRANDLRQLILDSRTNQPGSQSLRPNPRSRSHSPSDRAHSRRRGPSTDRKDQRRSRSDPAATHREDIVTVAALTLLQAFNLPALGDGQRLSVVVAVVAVEAAVWTGLVSCGPVHSGQRQRLNVITLRTTVMANLLDEIVSAYTRLTVAEVLSTTAKDEKGAAQPNMRGMVGEPVPLTTIISLRDGTWTASVVVVIEISEYKKIFVTEVGLEAEGVLDTTMVHDTIRYQKGTAPDLNTVKMMHPTEVEGEHKTSLQSFQPVAATIAWQSSFRSGRRPPRKLSSVTDHPLQTG
ncbi:unnamed protein product [Mortierella alpina]